MDDEIVIKYQNKIYKFKKTTSFYEIGKSFRDVMKYEPLAVLVDNEVKELSEKLVRTCFIDFVDINSRVGSRIYERGLIYIYLVAVKKVLGEDAVLQIEHSIDKGIFTSINKELNQYVLLEIENNMKELIAANILFEKNNILRKDAIKYFNNINRPDKAEALKYISNTYITLYKFGETYDYFYGEMPYSSGAIKKFRLDLVEGKGIIVSYPSMYLENDEMNYKHHKLLFDAFEDFKKYQTNLKISTISNLNSVVTSNNINDLIKTDEAYQNKRLIKIVDDIVLRKNELKIILVAGPSSSGKTTTSKKLKLFLQGQGIKANLLSLDDYFKERYETPRDENGEYDFECLEAIDVELFEATLQKLLDGQNVKLPTYNFINGKKEYNKSLQLGQDDVLIIEGLHGLNEKLTASIPKNKKTKIYISPLTNLNIDLYNRIHTTDMRLIRRTVRDSKHRGYDASNTLKAWKSVRRGEEKYVFPYQDEADYILNTALIYELGVLKVYVEPLLFSVNVEDENYSEAIRLIDFLRNVLPIPSDEVPSDSILREFIGNSIFR